MPDEISLRELDSQLGELLWQIESREDLASVSASALRIIEASVASDLLFPTWRTSWQTGEGVAWAKLLALTEKGHLIEDELEALRSVFREMVRLVMDAKSPYRKEKYTEQFADACRDYRSLRGYPVKQPGKAKVPERSDTTTAGGEQAAKATGPQAGHRPQSRPKDCRCLEKQWRKINCRLRWQGRIQGTGCKVGNRPRRSKGAAKAKGLDARDSIPCQGSFICPALVTTAVTPLQFQSVLCLAREYIQGTKSASHPAGILRVCGEPVPAPYYSTRSVHHASRYCRAR